MVVIVGERAVNLERVSTVHIVSGVITMSDGHEFGVLPEEAALSRLPAGVPLSSLAQHVSPLGVWEEGEA